MSDWRGLLSERLEEAVLRLGSIPGVHGLVVGGSVGRGEPWPLSDIDLIPICSPEAMTEIARRQAELVDWWAASARAQTLDVGWLAFSPDDVRSAITSAPIQASELMLDPRWLHGTDKAFGGYGASDPDGLASSFADWATRTRFSEHVRTGRLQHWQRYVRQSYADARERLQAGDRIEATILMREAGRGLRLVLVELWAERLGSMGREWTRFERMAAVHDAEDLAARIAYVAGAGVVDTAAHVRHLPMWLLERIDRSLEGRREVAEEVTEAENARDQIAAFRVHVVRHSPELMRSDWLALPDPQLDRKMMELEVLVEARCIGIDGTKNRC